MELKRYRCLMSLCLAGAVLVATVAWSGEALARTKGKSVKARVEQTKAEKGRGTGPDTNIKNDQDKNDPNSPRPAPANKGGEKAKGAGPATCQVKFDNSTGYYIRVYVDGTYRGTMDPWGDYSLYTGSGSTDLYAVAVFTDGTRLTWGPKAVSCSGLYSWRLVV